MEYADQSERCKTFNNSVEIVRRVFPEVKEEKGISPAPVWMNVFSIGMDGRELSG